eukprot:11765334-Ditylum_brightwellii.AAC.1
MLSEEKKLEGKDSNLKKGRGPKYMPPAPGHPNWRVYHRKMTKGVNIPGYLTDATTNGHQHGAGKCAQMNQDERLNSNT